MLGFGSLRREALQLLPVAAAAGHSPPKPWHAPRAPLQLDDRDPFATLLDRSRFYFFHQGVFGQVLAHGLSEGARALAMDYAQERHVDAGGFVQAAVNFLDSLFCAPT